MEGSDVLRIGYPTVLLRSSFQRRGKEHGLPRRIYPLPSSLSLSFLISLCVLTLSIPPLRVLNYTFGARSRASLKHPASSSSSLRLFSLFSFSLSLSSSTSTAAPSLTSSRYAYRIRSNFFSYYYYYFIFFISLKFKLFFTLYFDTDENKMKEIVHKISSVFLTH